ncbi:hypothetical protein Ahia01_000371500, partial [Argonauta hians]
MPSKTLAISKTEPSSPKLKESTKIVQDLKHRFQTGDITEVDYWHQLPDQFSDVLSVVAKQQIQGLKTELEEEILTIKGFCKKMEELLWPSLSESLPRVSSLKP